MSVDLQRGVGIGVLADTRSDRGCLLSDRVRCPMRSGCDHFLLRHRHCIYEGLHRRLAEAPAALMRSRFIVLAQPNVKVCLQLVERVVYLLAERHSIELVERSLVEAFRRCRWS